MLVLTRKFEQRIVMIVPPSKDHVRIDVAPMRPAGHGCKLGVEAPRDVIIHREEIYSRIHEEREDTA